MYKKDEKKASLAALSGAIVKFSPTGERKILGKNQSKKADSHLATVEMPKADKPTAAGEETSELEQKPEEKVLSSENKMQNSPVVNTNPEMKKLSVVLSQAVRQAMSSKGQYTPHNVGLPNRPTPPAPVNPPPVGAAPQPQQAQQAQPQNPAAYQGALGGPGAISPSSNPINNYGPISRSGDINGNAAFGVKNSPDSNKSASDFAKKLIQGASVAVPAAAIGATYGYYRNKKKKPDVAPEEHAAGKVNLNSVKPEQIPPLFDDMFEPTPVKYDLPAYSYNPKLHAALQQWDNSTANAKNRTALPPNLARPLGNYLRKLQLTPRDGSAAVSVLPKGQTPDSLDAIETLLELEAVAPKQKSASSPAWQRAAGKNDEGGLNAKGRASYNKATGGNLKAPVTESNPSGDRAKRQNSFCARMCGMKSKETGAKTKADPDSRINKALSKWNCKCGSAYEFGQMLSGKSAASICSILDNKDMRSEGKQVEDVKPTFQETENKADLNPNDATNKEQKQAARGDATRKLLSRLDNDILFREREIRPAGKAVTGGWQTTYGVVGAPNRVSHHFDPRSVREIDTPPVKGRDLIKNVKDKLPLGGRMPVRGGDMYDEPERVAKALRELRQAVKNSSVTNQEEKAAGSRALDLALLGYKYLGGVIPMPDVSLRMGKQSSVALDIYYKAARQN